MTSNFRLDLVGKKVLLAERDMDGVGLQLSDGWNIAIWTVCTVRRALEEGDATEDLSQLVGSSLLTFVGDEATEKLTFDNGYAIDVDLRAGPDSVAESMAVYGPENLIVVWE